VAIPPPTLGVKGNWGPYPSPPPGGGPEGGVTSLNAETGDVILESLGGTIAITKPDATHINLEATHVGVDSWNGQTGDVKGTLANIFAFGAGDDAFNDNNFPMDSGNWRWPGPLDWGAGHLGAAEAWFQNRLINMGSPPAASLKVQAMNLSGIGGNGCGSFDNLLLQDPFWNGFSFSALGNMAWVREIVGASNSILQTSGFAGVEYARKTYFPNGLSPMVPGLGQLGAAMRDSENLYNSTAGVPVQVRSLGGFGDEEQLLTAVQNGASAQWVTHWNNDTLAPAVGDGPAWWVDVDSRFGRFRPAAGLQFYQTDPNVFKAWGSKIWVTDDAGVLSAGLDIDHTRGLLNGAPISVVPSATSGSATAMQAYSLDCDPSTLGDKGVLVPKRAGAVFVISRWSQGVVAKTGAAVTTAPLYNIGSIGPTFVDIIGGTGSNTLSATNINEGVGAWGSQNIIATATAQTANTDIHLVVATAQVGATTLTIRTTATGFWQALP
jgi:hypothetical protein